MKAMQSGERRRPPGATGLAQLVGRGANGLVEEGQQEGGACRRRLVEAAQTIWPDRSTTSWTVKSFPDPLFMSSTAASRKLWT